MYIIGGVGCEDGPPGGGAKRSSILDGGSLLERWFPQGLSTLDGVMLVPAGFGPRLLTVPAAAGG